MHSEFDVDFGTFQCPDFLQQPPPQREQWYHQQQHPQHQPLGVWQNVYQRPPGPSENEPFT